MILKQAFIDVLKAELGEELPLFLEEMQRPYHRGLRLNVKKCALPPDQVQEEIPWAKHAYYIPNHSKLGASILHEAGAFYLQEPSAMAPVMALDVQKNDKVLDLCAAPGGKSTQIASFLGESGLLVSNEPNMGRAQVLSSNIERLGVENAIVISALPQDICDKWEGVFDKILVDAPCSGEGMFRRHPETMEQWNETSPKGCAQRQKTILDCAAKMLKKGGKMVYSTCTYSACENQEQIQAFLNRHTDFALQSFALKGLEQAKEGMLRIWPHKNKGEGHFVAVLQKAGQGEEKVFPFAYPLLSTQESQLCNAFFDTYMLSRPTLVAPFMGRIIQPPTTSIPLDGIKVLRVGLVLGQAKSKVFIPDHALAMARPFKQTIALDEALCQKWIHGESLHVDTDMKGFVAPTYMGLQLGFGKVSDGQVKNHYPKGLRK